MGIKQTITQDELPVKYQAYSLIETKDGVSHSVYLLEDMYVLKIVTIEELNALKNEQKLLEALQNMPVPILLDIVQKEDCILAFYTQIDGTSQTHPNITHIKEIALFLKEFHSISKNLTSSNIKIYEKEYLKNLVIQTDDKVLLNHFNSIKCILKNDGIIHGDLFYDNAKFQNDTLSGVYDFIEACESDFIFELAVVSISWCFDGTQINREKITTLLETYKSEIEYNSFVEYIKYALLYYATTRHLSNRNYQELLEKLENL